jgi:hypothetical protein
MQPLCDRGVERPGGRDGKARARSLRREGVVADHKDTHVGESPEHVAYRLLERIADVEGVLLTRSDGGKVATRKWILDTYAECLDAVRANRRYNKPMT